LSNGYAIRPNIYDMHRSPYTAKLCCYDKAFN
jgi:hypothetical protein